MGNSGKIEQAGFALQVLQQTGICKMEGRRRAAASRLVSGYRINDVEESELV